MSTLRIRSLPTDRRQLEDVSIKGDIYAPQSKCEKAGNNLSVKESVWTSTTDFWSVIRNH